MKEHCTCPKCGHDFDPDEQRRELENRIRGKIDHKCYDGASFKWMHKHEMYVYLPRDGIYTTTVEDRQLPDDWKIGTLWCKDSETVVSIVLDE